MWSVRWDLRPQYLSVRYPRPGNVPDKYILRGWGRPGKRQRSAEAQAYKYQADGRSGRPGGEASEAGGEAEPGQKSSGGRPTSKDKRDAGKWAGGPEGGRWCGKKGGGEAAGRAGQGRGERGEGNTVCSESTVVSAQWTTLRDLQFVAAVLVAQLSAFCALWCECYVRHLPCSNGRHVLGITRCKGRANNLRMNSKRLVEASR